MFSFQSSFPSSSSASSSYPPPPPPPLPHPPQLPFYLDPENAFAASDTVTNNTILHHDPLIGFPCFMPISTHQAAAPITIPTAETTANNLMVSDHYCAASSSMLNNGNGAAQYVVFGGGVTKKPPASGGGAKKDRHSKIFTSQGLRDRRVRLSSEIARKFFDLQDMLEYDKPSNTLEWLFTKSENAIKELARTRHYMMTCEEEERKLNNKELDNDVVCVVQQAKKESREKARARARVRTTSKICSSNGGSDENKRFPAAAASISADPQILHQLKMMPHIIHPHTHHLVVRRDNGFEAINNEEESLVLKREYLKPSSLPSTLHHHHHHQNYLDEIEIPNNNKGTISFNNNEYHHHSISLCPNSPPNWDDTEIGVALNL